METSTIVEKEWRKISKEMRERYSMEIDGDRIYIHSDGKVNAYISIENPKVKNTKYTLEISNNKVSVSLFKALIDHIKAAVKDESSAENMYLNYASEADKADRPVMASTLREIAADERKHYGLLNSMLRMLERDPEI